MTEPTQEIKEAIASQETATRKSARRTSKLRRWLAVFIALGVVLVFVLIAAGGVVLDQIRDDVRAQLARDLRKDAAAEVLAKAEREKIADAAANLDETFDGLADAIESGNADIRKLRRTVEAMNESVRNLQQAGQRSPTIVFPPGGGDPQVIFPTPAPPPPGPGSSGIDDPGAPPAPTPRPGFGEDLICVITLACDLPLDEDPSAQEDGPSLLDLLLGRS